MSLGAKKFDRYLLPIFPTLDLYILDYFHWNLGVGFGLTDVTDYVVLKSVFSFEYAF